MKTSYSYYDIQGLCFLSNEKEKKPQTDLCENENEQIEFQAPKQQYFQKILKYHYQRKKNPKKQNPPQTTKIKHLPPPPTKKGLSRLVDEFTLTKPPNWNLLSV